MEDTVAIPATTLTDKFRSKHDIYNRLTKDAQFYLPPYRKCPAQFLKEILKGVNLAFKKKEISCFHVPYYKELRVNKLYPKLKGDEKILKYLPSYCESELSDREFFFSIVSTLYLKETQFLIITTRANRSIKVETDKDEMIEVSKDMLTELENLLVHPTTPGSGVFLLKAKVHQRKKKKIPAEFEVDLRPFLSTPITNRRMQRKQPHPARDFGERLNDDMNVDNDRTGIEEDKHNI